MNIAQRAVLKRALLEAGTNPEGLSDEQLQAQYQGIGEAPVMANAHPFPNSGLPPVQEPRLSSVPVQPTQPTQPSGDLLTMTINMLKQQGYSFEVIAISPTGERQTISIK